MLIAGLFIGQLAVIEKVYADRRAVIKSGSEYDYPPFSVVSEDGKADGFSVELLREALSVLNLDVGFKIGEWDKLKKELSAGAIQVLPLVGRTPERETVFDFTFPYLTLHGAVFVRKGETRIKKVSDLADKTVLVMRGDNAEEFARRTNISSQIIAVGTYAQAMQLLEAGKYDAVIAQRLMGIYLLNKMRIKKVAPLDFVLYDLPQDFCFAVREGDKTLLSTLNEGLSIVIGNGTFDRLHKKWFGPFIQEHLAFKDVVKYALIVFILTIVTMTLILIVMLRREVKRKTKTLLQEIGERKLLQEELASIFDLVPDLICVASTDGYFKKINQAWEKTLGFTVDELLSRPFSHFIHPDDYPATMVEVARQIGKQSTINFINRYLCQDGSYKFLEWNAIPSPDGTLLYAAVRDVTDRMRAEEALRESENKYRELSIVDALTQLYNSRYFYHQLETEIERANRYGQPLTLQLLDLDDFKRFNDTYGHIEGDRVLMRLGQVMRRCLRQTDTAYRYGGEEFTILLPMATCADGAVIAERIRMEFKKEPFSPLPDQEVHMTVSIGLGQYKPQEEMKAFVHRVDQLMYRGKKNGKDRVCFEP